jgi:hypothetical protein
VGEVDGANELHPFEECNVVFDGHLNFALSGLPDKQGAKASTVDDGM